MIFLKFRYNEDEDRGEIKISKEFRQKCKKCNRYQFPQFDREATDKASFEKSSTNFIWLWSSLIFFTSFIIKAALPYFYISWSCYPQFWLYPHSKISLIFLKSRFNVASQNFVMLIFIITQTSEVYGNWTESLYNFFLFW